VGVSRYRWRRVHGWSDACVQHPTQAGELFGKPESTFRLSQTLRKAKSHWDCAGLLCEQRGCMAGMSAAALCAAGSVCIIQALLRDMRGRDPPRLATACAQFFPSGRWFAGAPTLANLRPGPRGPGFFRHAKYATWRSPNAF